MEFFPGQVAHGGLHISDNLIGTGSRRPVLELALGSSPLTQFHGRQDPDRLDQTNARYLPQFLGRGVQEPGQALRSDQELLGQLDSRLPSPAFRFLIGPLTLGQFLHGQGGLLVQHRVSLFRYHKPSSSFSHDGVKDAWHPFFFRLQVKEDKNVLKAGGPGARIQASSQARITRMERASSPSRPPVLTARSAWKQFSIIRSSFSKEKRPA